jgi:uncharacterized protein YndB with AHSA1/START domain
LVDESVAIAASAPDVWRAIVVAEVRAGWWGHLDIDATVGGRFEERWTDGGGREVLTGGEANDVVIDGLLILCWADDDWPTTMRVEIRLAETCTLPVRASDPPGTNEAVYLASHGQEEWEVMTLRPLTSRTTCDHPRRPATWPSGVASGTANCVVRALG